MKVHGVLQLQLQQKRAAPLRTYFNDVSHHMWEVPLSKEDTWNNN